MALRPTLFNQGMFAPEGQTQGFPQLPGAPQPFGRPAIAAPGLSIPSGFPGSDPSGGTGFIPPELQMTREQIAAAKARQSGQVAASLAAMGGPSQLSGIETAFGQPQASPQFGATTGFGGGLPPGVQPGSLGGPQIQTLGAPTALGQPQAAPQFGAPGNLFPGGIPGLGTPQAAQAPGAPQAGLNPALAGLDPNMLRALQAQGITSQEQALAPQRQLSTGGDGSFSDVPGGFDGLIAQFQNAPGGFNQQAFQQEIERRGFGSRAPANLGNVGGQPPGSAPGTTPGITPAGGAPAPLGAPGAPGGGLPGAPQNGLNVLDSAINRQTAGFGGSFAGGAPQTGVIGAEQALRGGFQGGLENILGGLGEFGRRTDQGVGQLTQFAEPGQQAAGVRGALSGALGPEAQAQAIADFQESPGQSFLRERGERSILRNQAATGGLGGGNVLRELQREGIGLAAQDFGNAFDRLGQVSGEGLGAAGQIANLRAGQGQGGLQAGFQGANLAQGTGSQLAGIRTGAGQDIAGAIGSTTSALSNLINQQGGDISDLLGGAGGNLANILAGAGAQQGGSNQALAALLANILAGQGSTVAGLQGIPGVTETGGVLGNVGAGAEGLGTGLTALAALSDRELKTNIKKIGQLNSGTNIYSWDWNEEGKRIAGNQPGFGVIAQEVNQDAVHRGADGYLRVDYSRVV